ncbi:MAG: IS3 family transposase [bacterium]|nr:IS3 family transposase [bacterium]
MSKELSGYSAKSVYRALEINKSTYYRWLSESKTDKKRSYKEEFYENVLSLIKQILSDKRYCMYGHRRVRALLKRKHNIKIGVKKVGKLMRKNGLCQSHHTRRNGFKKIEKPEVTGTNQFWQIDMTIGYLEDSMPIYTVGIKDVFTREILALKGYLRARSINGMIALMRRLWKRLRKLTR